MDGMSDTFWVSFFTLATLVAKSMLDEWRARRQAAQNFKIASELHENTIRTIQGNAEVSKQIDSATRETTEHAVEAKKAASSAAEKAGKIEEKADSIEKKTDKIEERLNGGDAGLGARITKNETRLDNLEKGQDAITRSVDQLVISFAAFAKRFDKSHPEV